MLFRSKKKNGLPVGTFNQNSWKVNITPKINSYLEDMKEQIIPPQVVGHGSPDAAVKNELELMADNLTASIKDVCFVPQG
jgi:hypothetical protein